MNETLLVACSSMSDRATRTVSVAEVATSTSPSPAGLTMPWTTRPDLVAMTEAA